MVVLDSCTADIVANFPHLQVLTVDDDMAGAARDRGIRAVLRALTADQRDLARVWIACTDADSTVPVDWLSTHIRCADQVADLVLGTVRPDLMELDAATAVRWFDRHALVDGHDHVHGANMGGRADRGRSG